MDAWTNPRFVKKFRATVEVLYMTRADIEKAVKDGDVPKSEYDKYWKRTKAKHLEEVAVRLSPDDWSELKRWAKTWRHEGGSFYLKGYGFAVRSGGANQSRDPLNVFFVSE